MTVHDVNEMPPTLAGLKSLVIDSVYHRGLFGYAVPSTVNFTVEKMLLSLQTEMRERDVLSVISAAVNEMPNGEFQTLHQWQTAMSNHCTGANTKAVINSAVTAVFFALNAYRTLHGDAAALALIEELNQEIN